VTTTFDAALQRFAAFDDKELSAPWSFRDKPMDVRYALYRTIEDAQEVLVRLAAQPHPEARHILALAQRAFGDLRGLLTGLPVDLMDRPPHEGEWSIRETLRHIIVIEGRYAVATRYAVERDDTDPIRVSADLLPTPAQTDVSGTVDAILGRVRGERAATDRRLADLPADALTRPTQWVHYDVDVRFRLHRFAAHLIEHTVQCEKTLAELGFRITEGRRVVRRLTGLLGEIEGYGGVADARDLEQLFVVRAASVAS
jgi:hypothetical protein